MVDVQEISPRVGDVLLLVGTTKGAFLFRAPATRRRWESGGPHFPGHAVYAMAYDGRAGRRRVWAAPESAHWGARAALVATTSAARGATTARRTVRFPEDTGKSLQRIWQIAGRDDDPQRMYCGVEPAALFESRDAGATWSLVRGLFDHPASRRAGSRAAAGCACTPCCPHPRDPTRIHVAISTAGVYRTDDGGAHAGGTAHRGVRAEFLPDKHPEFGQCVHKVVRHRERPGRDVPAEPLGPLPQRRRGRQLDGRRPRRAQRLRLRHGHPSPRSRRRSTSCPSSPTSSAARRKGSCACIAPGTARGRGSRSPAACRRRTRSRPCCATRCAPTRLPRAGVYFGTRSRQGVRLPRRRRALAR